MKYHIFLKDTDPDTGVVSQMFKLCECTEEPHAKAIVHALSMQDDSPNREYSIQWDERKRRDNLIVCIDPAQIDAAWKFQVWLRNQEVCGIICFSKNDLDLVLDTYVGHAIPHAVMIVGPTKMWKGVNFDLHINELDPLEFESILSFLE